MDDELRRAFALLSGQMSDVARDVHANMAMTKEQGHRLAEIESEVGQLKHTVFGSDPPPPGALIKKVSSSQLEVSALQGQMINLSSDMAKVKTINEAQNIEIREVKRQVGTIYNAITGFFGNPKVVMTGRIIFTALLTIAMARGWLHK